MLIENILYFLKKKKYYNKENPIKIYNKNIKINNYLINNYLAIHNGRFFIPLVLKNNMFNYFIGSFVFTKSIDLKKVVKRYNQKKKKKK
jgi:ribosomal protein S19